MPISKDKHPIASLEDWERLAKPKSPNHWKDGRSAKEVARAWLEGGGVTLPEVVHAVLAAHPHFGAVKAWDAEPEAKLRFDTFAGEPRNSDLCVLAEDAHGRYVLAVEAKADEPYGETVAEAFAAALERRVTNPRSRGIDRIASLCANLLRPQEPGTSAASALRYQLLTACAGAVAEANRKGVGRAVMLVHEFVTSATVDENHDRNALDLARFVGRMSGAAVERVPAGTLVGPFEFPAFAGVQLFIGKAVRRLRP